MTGQRVRASNSDRERVVDLLNEGLAEGRISLAEFVEHSAAANFATWADELAQFTADLPRRATHVQRASVVEQLGEAVAQGYIRFDEFEERSAAANQTAWADDLARFTSDLPQTFLAGAQETKPGRKLTRTTIISAVAALTCAAALILFVATRHDSEPAAAPATGVPAPVASPSTTAPSPSPSPPKTTPPQPTAKPAPAPAFTIKCDVGESGDEVTFFSVKKAWDANGGTYFCEADVPDSHRLTSLERAAVIIDQRISNGDSMIDSLEVLLGFCADTVDFDTISFKTEPLTVERYEDMDDDRLQAVYKLCPSAPTAKLMRQAIYNQ